MTPEIHYISFSSLTFYICVHLISKKMDIRIGPRCMKVFDFSHDVRNAVRRPRCLTDSYYQ